MFFWVLTSGFFLLFFQKSGFNSSSSALPPGPRPADSAVEGSRAPVFLSGAGRPAEEERPGAASLLFPPPAEVKAVYFTGRSAGTESRVDYLIQLASSTEINGVVIDIKDFSGHVLYDAGLSKPKEYGAIKPAIPDISSLVAKLHKNGIYAIARITVFQDPVLAAARPDLAVSDGSGLWMDNKGLAWIDPAAKEAWDYNIAIAKDALARGFDEINFDYVRFPSDGNLKNMEFPFWNGKTPRRVVMGEFFRYAREELPGARISVDFFGLSTSNSYDLGIGQVIEDAYEHFDFVSPMVYPSHYSAGFLGYANPAEHPYEVVKRSMEDARARLESYKRLRGFPAGRGAKLRPWLQDFSLKTDYTAEMVKSQIRAVREAAGDDFAGFMLWNPSNIYTKEALEPAGQIYEKLQAK